MRCMKIWKSIVNWATGSGLQSKLTPEQEVAGSEREEIVESVLRIRQRLDSLMETVNIQGQDIHRDLDVLVQERIAKLESARENQTKIPGKPIRLEADLRFKTLDDITTEQERKICDALSNPKESETASRMSQKQSVSG